MKPKKTILVVDDDEGMRDTLSAILKKDYIVRVAATPGSVFQPTA
jgi:DNA-binding NtrC family response regulator